MKPRILIADNMGDETAVHDLVQRLKPQAEVHYHSAISREELLSEIPSYDVLVVRSRTIVDRDLIDRASGLRLVITATHGSDHVDLEYLRSKGIEFRSVTEQANAVSEFVIGLLFSVARKVALADRLSKSGHWRKDDLIGVEISGRTIGVVGFGKIGQLVAEKASALGMQILICETEMTAEKKKRAERIGAEVVSLDELLRRSDFITLHVPKTRATSKMIGREQLASMKDGAFLINAARGDVVDEEVLVELLEKGRLGGVAIDVYSVQPPFSQSHLRNMIAQDRVVSTQHIGGQTKEARRRTIETISDVLEEFVARKPAKPRVP